jgi:hypothetical protein
MFGVSVPQVSIYIDKPLYMEIKSKAKERGVPFSNYIVDAVKEKENNEWPEDFFERFVGAIKDESFKAPEEIPWELNIKRKEL